MLIIIAVASLAACGHGGGAEATAPAMPPVFVETSIVKPEVMRDVAELVGQLEAEESVEIRPEVEGTITAVLFEEGAAVKAGTPLFRLRNDEQKAELAAAVARERLAADTHRRFKSLSEEEIMSKSEIERVTREHDVASAEVDRVRVRLDKMEIRAPFEGRLGTRKVSPGDHVETTTPLVDLHATKRLRLVFAVPERYAPVLRKDVAVEVNVAAYPDDWFPGKVYFVAPAVDAASRQLMLKGWVENGDGRLWPGQFARIRAEIARRDDALALPDSALVYDGQASFVWRVAAERKAERVTVETGLRQGGKIEIRKGIASGDEIVVAGTNKIFPGATLMTGPPPSAEQKTKPATPS
jgi:membrane fusion protein (multidrug efflux system)